MTMTDSIALEDMIRAQHRLTPVLQPTPLESAPELGENIWLKLENANKTGSFKVRGALNAILSMDEAARERGIIAVSSGNHAQAVAYAAHLTGARAQILMPKTTPQKKISGVRRYGGEALLFGGNYDEAEAEALRRAQAGRTWISPYNDRQVIAGAGTIGLEILAQLPNLERVAVPASGGGLCAGVAMTVKELQPNVEVIGVTAAAAPGMYNSFHHCNLPQVWDTLADALSGDIEAGSMTIPLARSYLDDVALVSEAQIAAAMRWMIETPGRVAEGGGAVGVAALLHDVIPRDGRATAVIVSGGNVDNDVLRRVL